jgi:hypothetical protein
LSDINTEQLNEFLAKAGITVPSPELGIGHEIQFLKGPKRTVVVHFAETDFPVHFKRIMEVILSIEPGWFLVPREGVFTASTFEKRKLSLLMDKLIFHLPHLTNVGEDMYIVGQSGKVLVAYDHHFKEEGLGIDFSDIEKAGLLLGLLNELGSELELLSSKS